MRGNSIAISWPSRRQRWRSESSPADELQKPEEAISQAARRRESQYPRPDDALDHSPFERARGLSEAHTHDGGRDAVGGRYRHAEMRSDRQDRRRARLGRKTVDRMQPHHLVAERLDDAPAARGGASRHRQGAG